MPELVVYLEGTGDAGFVGTGPDGMRIEYRRIGTLDAEHREEAEARLRRGVRKEANRGIVRPRRLIVKSVFAREWDAEGVVRAGGLHDFHWMSDCGLPAEEHRSERKPSVQGYDEKGRAIFAPGAVHQLRIGARFVERIGPDSRGGPPPSAEFRRGLVALEQIAIRCRVRFGTPARRRS